MPLKKIFPLFVLVLIILVGVALIFSSKFNPKPPLVSPNLETKSSIVNKKVKYPEDYTFVLLGDSMTAALGNSDELKKYLTGYYPGKTFEFLNYGFGSTSILSVEKRLQESTTLDRVYQPILNIDFDVILIESFGHNPLSQFPLDEGLKKQNEALDKIISLIRTSNPRAAIVFLATIAPNSKNYGKGQVNLSNEQRAVWAAERTAYIKNHILYAQNHNIPLVNVYEASLLNGDGNLIYFDKKNYIHPSPTGVVFISQQIADSLYKAKILDQIKKD